MTAANREGIDATAFMAVVPQALLRLPQWLVWQYEALKGKDKPTKVPYCAATGRKGSSTNPDTWVRILEALKASREYDGVGLAIRKQDGYTGVDLDHCRDIETGAIEPWAMAIVEQMRSYTEISPSGTGLRIWIRASLPGPGRRKGDIELYDNERYFTVTGNHLAGTPLDIRDAQEDLDRLYARVFAEVERGARRAPDTSGISLDDDALLEKARNASNSYRFEQLWNGDASAYAGNASSADMALCCHLAFWTRADPDRMDTLFRRSGLMRDKWDERRRDTTYGQMTIAAALAVTDKVYEPRLVQRKGARAVTQDIGERVTQGPPDGPDADPDECQKSYKCTEFGNVERLLAAYGRYMRYNPSYGWIAWDGKRWRLDAELDIRAWAKAAIRAMYAESARLSAEAARAVDEDEQKRLSKAAEDIGKWARASQTNHMVTSMVALARDACQLDVEAFDKQPLLFNCLSGTLDLRTGKIRDHSPEDYITQLCRVEYDEAADAPTFLRFLSQIMLDRDELVDYLRRVFGYCLSGSVKEQVWHLLIGKDGDNGKSTLIETLLYVLGDYATVVRPEMVTLGSMKQDENAPSPAIARVNGKRLVSISETQEGARLDTAKVKVLSGGDTLTGRFMRKDDFTFTPSAKVFIHTNHAPQARETTHAFWRRVRLIPFDFTLKDRPEAEKDRDLAEKLRAEASGILAWLVQGAMEWQGMGLCPPAIVLEKTQAYRDESDTLKVFLDERTEDGPPEVCRVALAALYEAYKEWCKEAGEREKPSKLFAASLRERGYEQRKGFGPTGSAGFIGLRLRSAETRVD